MQQVLRATPALNKAVSYAILGKFKSLIRFSTNAQENSNITKETISIEILNKKDQLELIILEKPTSIKRHLKYNPHWLRFNCILSKSSSGQRTISSENVPLNLTIENVEKLEDDCLLIKWNESSNQKDSLLPISYLINQYPSSEFQKNEKNFKFTNKIKYFEYEKFSGKHSNDEAIYEWLKHTAEYGFSIVKNVPTIENTVLKLAELIAPVQSTIYGKIFDIKVEPNPINIAYSNQELEFHMDLMYYESPPGLQFLHCIQFDPQILGGESILLDAFEVAEEFREKHPKYFDGNFIMSNTQDKLKIRFTMSINLVLSKIPATYQKVHIERARPVFMIYQRPHIVTNHQNKDEIKSYYESYLTFSKFIKNHPKSIVYRLKPGEAICFNNRRILHGRKGFELNGVRHFQGCYVNIDEFKSELLTKEYFLKSRIKNRPLELSELECEKLLFGNNDYN